MSVRSELITILKNTNIPIYSNSNQKNVDDTYIILELVNDNYVHYSDNTALDNEYYFVINIYSKYDIDDISEEIKTLIFNSSFKFISRKDGNFEDSTKLYRSIMQVYFYKEL